jgi:hypothetical protein
MAYLSPGSVADDIGWRPNVRNLCARWCFTLILGEFFSSAAELGTAETGKT